MSNRLILGAMSGTSADGVDVAVTRITGRGLEMRATLVHLTGRRFPPALRRMIRRLRSEPAIRLADLASMGRDLTLAYAAACRDAMKHAGRPVAAVAAHGQTLFHAPPLTIQYFDPSLLACELGVPVISDFRRADCAVGGQGAPLVPFADYLMFRDRRVGRVLLNIGGIANITWLKAGGELADVIAFDTGPGNCLSDAVAQEELSRGYDVGGRMAAKGRPDEKLVDAYLANAYFRRKWPKSTDGPEMLAMFRRLPGIARLSLQDRLATACLCCARAIAQSVRQVGTVGEIVVAGGGANNATIMRMLAAETGMMARTTADSGIPTAAREAMAFALLGAATLDGVPSNVPSVTGAEHPVVLGSITNAARR
jgi:anhydro-N-acetylmuramic acid kinase